MFHHSLVSSLLIYIYIISSTLTLAPIAEYKTNKVWKECRSCHFSSACWSPWLVLRALVENTANGKLHMQHFMGEVMLLEQWVCYKLNSIYIYVFSYVQVTDMVVEKLMQEVRVVMETCTAKGTVLARRLWALLSSTVVWAVEHVTRCDATTTPNGASMVTSLSRPPTSAHLIKLCPMTMAGGAILLSNTSIWLSLLSCRLLSIVLGLSLYSSEGKCVLVFEIM